MREDLLNLLKNENIQVFFWIVSITFLAFILGLFYTIGSIIREIKQMTFEHKCKMKEYEMEELRIQKQIAELAIKQENKDKKIRRGKKETAD